MNEKEIIINKIHNKNAVIGIVGLGYVGLPLALSCLDKDFRVIGFDTDDHKIEILKKGESYIKHIPSKDVKGYIDNNNFSCTSDFSKIKNVDIILICVPTPLGKHNEPDVSYITDVIAKCKPYIRKGQMISLESSTYPGTTDELIVMPLQELLFVPGEDIFILFSPEREDPGNQNFSTSTIPKVVGGVTKECLEVGCYFYELIITKVVPVSSTKVAEMSKLLENIYRSVNIGLVNELKVVADKMGINIWEVIDAASTKPFGFTPFYPGPGLGGHCIPIDPFYLTWKAKEYGVNTKFIELAGEINTNMPNWVTENIVNAINQCGVSIKNAKCLILGLAYKKNIDDVRESPAMKIIDNLIKRGADVFIHDPYVTLFTHYEDLMEQITSVELSEKTIRDMDCVIIATDHDEFDYELIYNCSRLIVDTRGRYKDKNDKIVRS